MNWEAIGAIGEIVGAVAVVVTLVYLSIQIRKSDVSTRAATTQILLGKSTDLLFQNALNFRADEMSQQQRDLFFYAIVNHFSNAHYQRTVGTLDDEAWEMFEARIRRIVYDFKGFDEWWAVYRINFTRRFKDYVDEIRKGA